VHLTERTAMTIAFPHIVISPLPNALDISTMMSRSTHEQRVIRSGSRGTDSRGHAPSSGTARRSRPRANAIHHPSIRSLEQYNIPSEHAFQPSTTGAVGERCHRRSARCSPRLCRGTEQQCPTAAAATAIHPLPSLHPLRLS